MTAPVLDMDWRETNTDEWWDVERYYPEDGWVTYARITSDDHGVSSDEDAQQWLEDMVAEACYLANTDLDDYRLFRIVFRKQHTTVYERVLE